MNNDIQVLDNIACLKLSGHFDFEMHDLFKKTYTPLINDASISEIEIDLSRVEYLGSAALSMLILLKEHTRETDKTITLLNPSGLVSHVLEIANFNQIFPIKHT